MDDKNKKQITQEELLWKIYESTEKTRKFLVWNRVFSIIKIIIIVIPIILAIIFIPPYLTQITAPYMNMMNSFDNVQKPLQNFDFNNLLNLSK